MLLEELFNEVDALLIEAAEHQEYKQHIEALHAHLKKHGASMSGPQLAKMWSHVEELKGATASARDTAYAHKRGITKDTATQPKGRDDIRSHRITNTAGHTVVAKSSRFGIHSLHTKAGKEIPGEHGGVASVRKKHGEGKYAHHFTENINKENIMNENYDLSPIADTITLVANGQAGEATPIVHDLLGARVLDALQSHKQEIAQTLFAPSADSLSEGTYDLPGGGETRDSEEAEQAWKSHHKNHPASTKSQFTSSKKAPFVSMNTVKAIKKK